MKCMNPCLDKYECTNDIFSVFILYFQVASYDFIIPVTINQTGAPSPSATPFPPTPAPSQKNSIQHIINPRPVQVTIATPRRKVIATALRQPLQLSHNKVDFVVSPGFHELSTSSGIGHTKVHTSGNYHSYLLRISFMVVLFASNSYKFHL